MTYKKIKLNRKQIPIVCENIKGNLKESYYLYKKLN